MEFNDLRPELLRAVAQTSDEKLMRIALLHLYVLAVRGSDAVDLLHNTIHGLPEEDRRMIYMVMYNAVRTMQVQEPVK